MTAVCDDIARGIQVFFDGAALVVRPAVEEITGPEIATLVFPDTNEWEVWTTGEGPFEYLRETL